jgi:hypothetical protein
MRKKSKKTNYDNFGLPSLDMPDIPNLAYFINQGQSDAFPLSSGIQNVAKATSMGFDYNEREDTKNIRKRRRRNLFERGQRLNSGEAPLSDYEIYQYQNNNDRLGGKNRPERTQSFGLF